jgi:plasmid stability protein
MATLTIRNVPDETHQALRMRAARNGRSVEEEVRRILAEQASAEILRNPKSPEEIAAAVKKLQNHFAPMRKTYSVDRFLAEKHAEAAAEFAEAKAEFKK